MMEVFDPSVLKTLVSLRMPFGKYRGVIICNLPENYLLWFKNKGFPPGKLGQALALMLEIKINGLEYLLNPLK